MEMRRKDPYPITDKSILRCCRCGRHETGLMARLRRIRHPLDRGLEYADCLKCGGETLPLPNKEVSDGAT